MMPLRIAPRLLAWAGIPLASVLASAMYMDGQTAYTLTIEDLPAQIERTAQATLSQKQENARLSRDLETDTRYIVIDTRRNRLRLCQAGRVDREAACATGSNKSLAYRWRRWRFQTPLGRFRVEKKEKGPVWIKPAWAFVEDQEPIPVLAEAFQRFEAGVLGEYALHFANGYMIHGSLYENRIGQSITHGCVRLRGEDLGYLYEHTEVGTPIYIY